MFKKIGKITLSDKSAMLSLGKRQEGRTIHCCTSRVCDVVLFYWNCDLSPATVDLSNEFIFLTN